MEEIIELKTFENKVSRLGQESKGEFMYLKMVE